MFRAVMLSAVALCAQSGDWAQVQALVPGAEVDVKRFSGGGVVRGTVESASADEVVVRRKSDAVTVDRSDARRVRLYSGEKTKLGRITGASILGGLAVPAAMITDGSGGARAAMVPVYAGFGYLIGSAFDGPKRITIFEARRRQ